MTVRKIATLFQKYQKMFQKYRPIIAKMGKKQAKMGRKILGRFLKKLKKTKSLKLIQKLKQES